VQNKTYGYFDAMIDWDACGSINEPWASLDRYHMRWVQPLGEAVTNYNNQVRWSNAEYSAIVDEMSALPLGDPQIDDLFVDAMGIWLEELPFIPLVQDKQLVSFDTTYWQGWPTANNNYVHPPSWWQSAHIIIHHLEPAEQ
jgi:peptide/nickel transport system substrate-binding protein